MHFYNSQTLKKEQDSVMIDLDKLNQITDCLKKKTNDDHY